MSVHMYYKKRVRTMRWRKMRPVVLGVALGLLILAGYSFGRDALWGRYDQVIRQKYVVMPDNITDEWLKTCLSRVDGVNVRVVDPGSLRFFCCNGRVMSLLTYDDDEQILTFITGINVEYNQYLYEIANYRNLAGSFQRLGFDEEKEFLFLTMNVDAVAGLTAAQVEHACLLFTRGMQDFYVDFIQ